MSLSNGTALSSMPLSIESSEAEHCPAKPALASLSLTGQVARGSMWSVGGQGVTLLVSLAATPLVIRLLGTEAYGVLALINLIVGYLAFSDLGMGTTSTRFGAEAHAREDQQGEAEVIWMSLLISAVPTLFAAVALIALARPLLTHALNVPAHLQPAAVLALRLAAVGFIARVVASILNTPQLVRLKIRLNSVITTASSVAQIGLTPIVLLMGGGLVGVAAVMSGVGMATVFTHALVSWRLVPQILHPRFDYRLMSKMAKFGGAIVISTLTGILLLNGEKILLTRFSSVNALAYYTVAFSLVNLLTIPANSLVQSLLPTFARLQAGGEEEKLQQLYDDMLRIILLITPVAALLICLGAKKFFIFWAGPDYGVVSPGPFYILMVGLFANLASYVPYCLLNALGRADFNARYHLVELVPYLLLAVMLTSRWGIFGAALAWSSRMVVGFPLFIFAVSRIFGLRCQFLETMKAKYFALLLILLPPLIAAITGSVSWIWLLASGAISSTIYLWVVYAKLIREEERAWFRQGAIKAINRCLRNAT